jgi:hypothetical protein
MPIVYPSAAALTQAVRLARADPHARFEVPGDFPLSASDVLQNFSAGVMRRCSRGLPAWDNARWTELLHDAGIINDAKKRIRWSGRNLLKDPRMARRYPHIHNPPPLED